VHPADAARIFEGMYVSATGTAVPARRYTKRDCWDAFVGSDWYARLEPRSHAIARAVLGRDNGIESRHLALETLDEAFAIDPDTLARRFAVHAPRLATEAAALALQRAGLEPADIDAVVVTTCTGYLCPGLSGYLVERLGLPRDARGFDLVGQGCAGALPNLQLASALLDSGQCAQVLSVCVEVCSAAMYLDDDPGVLVSACLFGDGAGAAVLSREPPRGRRRVAWRDSVSTIEPEAREALRFEQRGGLLRNVLTREVPILAAGRVAAVLEAALQRAGLERRQIAGWILHAGGRDVLAAVSARLDLDPAVLRYSRETLGAFGNLSSAFVLFVLDAALTDRAPGGWWWLSSFGAGFTCHGALLEVE
jgi:alkylresorcinol/alkylpyrone synthase